MHSHYQHLIKKIEAIVVLEIGLLKLMLAAKIYNFLKGQVLTSGR